MKIDEDVNKKSVLDIKDFIHTRRHTAAQNKFQFVIRKGVCPYDCVDNPDKMSERQLH